MNSFTLQSKLILAISKLSYRIAPADRQLSFTLIYCRQKFYCFKLL